MKRRAAAVALLCAASFASPRAVAAPTIASTDGTPVSFTASDPHTIIFLARGDVPENAPSTAFEKIGEAPIEVRVAPGVYTVETQESSSTLGHARFAVEQGKPITIDVRNGNATARSAGTALTGLGALAMLAGVVAIVSFGPHDESYRRWAIGIPLLAGGAGGVGVGIGLLAGGATDVKVPAASAQARGVSVVVRF